MSDINLATVAQPSVPSAGTLTIFADSADRVIKAIDEKGVVNSLVDSEMINYIRNSGMWFAQRQNPAAATNCGSTTLRAAGVLSGADGWGVWNENANTTYIRTDTAGAQETALQGRFYGSFAKITSTGKFFVSQMLEGHEVAALRGRTVRFQTWIKGTGAQTARLGLVQLTSAGTLDTLPATFISAAGANGTDPTLGTNLSYVAPKSATSLVGDNCTINGNAFDCSVTTSWQRFGGVFDVPTTCKNLLVCVWTNAQLAAASGFSISQLSMSDGYEIQNWTPLKYALERQRVERIYYKTFNIDTLPAASVGVNSGEFKFMCTVGAAAAFAGVGFRYPVPMRAAATTLTLFNPAAAGAQIRNVTDAADCTVSAVTADGEQACWINATSSAAAAAGEHLAVHITADACGANQEFA